MAAKTPAPQELAQNFLDWETSLDSSIFLPFQDMLWNENENAFYRYNRDFGYWSKLSDGDLRTGKFARIISDFLINKHHGLPITNARIAEIHDCLARQIKIRYDAPKPSIYSAFTDKTINFETFETIPHSPENFCFHSFAFSTNDLSNPTPNFDSYLEKTFRDPADRALVFEMIGYFLLPQQSLEPAAFYLYGQAKTGKTRLMNLILRIIGERFCSSFSLQSLTSSESTVAELSGIRLNILDEDESDRVSADKFKALVNNTPIQARRLYQAAFTMRQFAKFLIASNQLPNFKHIDGLERRLHFLHFKEAIEKEEDDKRLDEKLRAEIPGIVGKALTHLQAFIDRNWEFNFSQSSIDLKNEFIRMVKPTTLYIMERCNIIPPSDTDTKWTSNQFIYEDYVIWCKESGHQSLAAQNFHRQLLSIAGIKTKIIHDKKLKNLVLKFDPYALKPLL